jgi:hypothetical protein
MFQHKYQTNYPVVRTKCWIVKIIGLKKLFSIYKKKKQVINCLFSDLRKNINRSIIVSNLKLIRIFQSQSNKFVTVMLFDINGLGVLQKKIISDLENIALMIETLERCH